MSWRGLESRSVRCLDALQRGQYNRSGLEREFLRPMETMLGKLVYRLLPRNVFYGWWVLAATGVAVFFAAGTGPVTFTILVRPITEEFHSSDSELLGALTAAGLLSALFAPVIGRAVDRYGGRVLMTLVLFFLGLMMLLTAQAQGLWQFYLVYSVSFTLARSGVWAVSAPAIASNWFLRKRALAFAAIAVVLTLVTIPFPIGAQAIVDLLDWRWVWRIIGLAIIAVPLPLTWLVVRRRPEDLGLRPDGSPRPVVALGAGVQREGLSRAEQGDELGWTLREAFRTRTFWLLSGSLFLVMFPMSSMVVVMHTYFVELDISAGTAARLVSFYGFSSFLGALIWGPAIQRLSVRVLLAPFAALYGATIVLFVVVGGHPSLALVYLSLLPLGLGIMGMNMVGNQVWPDYYGRLEIGSIIGMSNMIRSVPMATGPLLAAGIHDTVGDYRVAFAVFAAFCFLAAIVLLFARPPRKEAARTVG